MKANRLIFVFAEITRFFEVTLKGLHVIGKKGFLFVLFDLETFTLEHHTLTFVPSSTNLSGRPVNSVSGFLHVFRPAV